MSKYIVRTNTGKDETVYGTRYDVESGTLHVIHARETSQGVVGVYVKSWAHGQWIDIVEVNKDGVEICKIGKEIDPPEIPGESPLGPEQNLN